MLADADDLLRTVDRIYAPLDPHDLPRPFLLLRGLRRVAAGEAPTFVAREARSTSRRIGSLATHVDPVQAVFGCTLDQAASEPAQRRPREMLGQLLLGEIAERAFEHIYRTAMRTDELMLEDDRGSRNETDYRVLNGQGRPVFRINIKFHGTPFRKARELVGLDPEDCFALATYKIYQGLRKQETERLPYLFVIVGVPGLTGASVGATIPDDLVHLVSLIHAARNVSGKRGVEERVVEYLLGTEQPEPCCTALRGVRERIDGADWYVVSARRADQLLRRDLFDRVYAVRVRAFARNYRNAELDMHLSLSKDLTPLERFLKDLTARGLHGISVDLERGVI